MVRTEAAENHSYHKCRDCYGRPMEPGTYMLTKSGQRSVRVTVSTDELTGDLGFTASGEGGAVQQRVEDCAADVVFSRINSTAGENPEAGEAEAKLTSMYQILQGAEEARRDLDELETELAAVMGCEVGDGSPIADAVMAAVRDGNGTPAQLLQHLQVES